MEKKTNLLPWIIGIIVIAAIVLGSIYLFKPKNVNTANLPTFKYSTNSWVGYGPMYLAQEKGFFKEEGINVEISRTDDQAQRTAAITKGDIDGYGDTVDLLVTTYAGGVPAITVMQNDLSNGSDGIITIDSIKTVQDLKGKTIAVQKNFVGESFLIYVLKKNGMTLKDVNTVDMESGAAGAAFAAGKVDAAVTFEPWLTKAKERQGGKVLVSSLDEPGVIVDTLSVNSTYLKNNTDNVKKVTRAWFKAVDYAKKNPAESNAIMAKYYDLSPADYADYITGVKWPTYQENLDYFGTATKPGPIFDVANIFSTSFLELGSITTKPDMTQAIDTNLLKNLYKK